jgi:hypothetical protein
MRSCHIPNDYDENSRLSACIFHGPNTASILAIVQGCSVMRGRTMNLTIGDFRTTTDGVTAIIAGS